MLNEVTSSSVVTENDKELAEKLLAHFKTQLLQDATAYEACAQLKMKLLSRPEEGKRIDAIYAREYQEKVSALGKSYIRNLTEIMKIIKPLESRGSGNARLSLIYQTYILMGENILDLRKF